MEGFQASIKALRKRLTSGTGTGRADIAMGDARALHRVETETIDLVLTSPPYLNAIDYLRGHRLSLVWLGHTITSLGFARSNSIGSERRPDADYDHEFLKDARSAVGEVSSLPQNYQNMIDRYLLDLHKMVSEVERVLKKGAGATFVMGNSCLKGVYIQNSEALASVAETAGLRLTRRTERELPSQHRYLPTPAGGALGKRMRKEIILTFAKAA